MFFEALEPYLKIKEFKTNNIELVSEKENFSFRLDYEGFIKKLISKKNAYLLEYTSFINQSESIEYIKEEAKIIDKNTLIVNGIVYHTKNIILASGGKVNLPDVTGINEALESNYLIRPEQLLGISKKPQTVIFYGAGKTAFELAILFSNLDIDCYLIARGSYLNNLDDDDKENYLNLIKNDHLYLVDNALIKEFRENLLFKPEITRSIA